MSEMLEPTRRPLSQAESRYVRAQIRSLSARGARTSKAYLPIAGAIVFALWLVTILLSDTSFIVITLFWLVAGGAIILWTGWEARKDAGHFESMVRHLDSALRRNAADVYDIRAKSFAEFEEIEDEGACYAFQLENDRMVFIAGQEFYPDEKFPSLDFSLVYLLDENDRPADMLIEKRGTISLQRSNIPQRIIRFCVPRQPNGIYDRDSSVSRSSLATVLLAAMLMGSADDDSYLAIIPDHLLMLSAHSSGRGRTTARFALV